MTLLDLFCDIKFKKCILHFWGLPLFKKTENDNNMYDTKISYKSWKNNDIVLWRKRNILVLIFSKHVQRVPNLPFHHSMLPSHKWHKEPKRVTFFHTIISHPQHKIATLCGVRYSNHFPSSLFSFIPEAPFYFRRSWPIVYNTIVDIFHSQCMLPLRTVFISCYFR